MKTTTHKSLPTTTTDASKDPAIQEAIDLIKRTLCSASKKDLTSKYIVGAKVEEVRASAGSEKYGKKAVAAIAQGVRLTPSCLYQYADVARTWDEGVFEDAGKRAAVAGLTFSHFVELAHGDHACQRDELLEEAIEKGLSVRELRRYRPKAEQTANHASSLELAADAPEQIDVLLRLAAEGATAALRLAIDEEVAELHRRAEEVQRRLEQLEAARATWAAALPLAAESSFECGKAAE